MSGRQAKKKRARERREILKRTLGPCHSCAFNPSTDTWRGFEKTTLGLMDAIREDRTFYCHEQLPRTPNGDWYFDPTLPPPARCRGWEAIAAHPETKRAAYAAIQFVGRPPRPARARDLPR